MWGDILMGLGEALRYMEAGRCKCILCGQSVSETVITGDGVGVCEKCYDRIMKSRATDYYDAGGVIKRLFAPFAYQGELRNAIFEFKFGGSYRYGDILAALVYDALPPYYVYDDYDIIVPVPLHPKRLHSRGFNQAELLADSLSKRLGVPIVTEAIFRTRNTLRQMTLTRSLRERNVSGAFHAIKEEVLGKRILLVDDIYTAGVTARACAKEMLDKGAEEVSVIAVGANFHKRNNYPEIVRIPTVVK